MGQTLRKGGSVVVVQRPPGECCIHIVGVKCCGERFGDHRMGKVGVIAKEVSLSQPNMQYKCCPIIDEYNRWIISKFVSAWMINEWMNESIFIFICHVLSSLITFLFIFPVFLWRKVISVGLSVGIFLEASFERSPCKLIPLKPVAIVPNFQVVFECPWYIILWEKVAQLETHTLKISSSSSSLYIVRKLTL